jgi:hypothetical protein
MASRRPYALWVKWATLALLLASAFILSCFAFGDSIRNIFDAGLFINIELYPFNAREWVALLTPIAAYFLAQIFHVLDERFRGGGIRNRVHDVKRANSYTYDLNPSAIAATMTKQSVLTAIAAILLAVLQGYRQGGNPDLGTTREFSFFAARLSMFGFLVSIVLLLVSMKCYDYACRFNLVNMYRAELVSKGLTLDIWSWYLLLFSLTIGVASLNPTVSIMMSFVAGYLLWWYYFIHPRAEIRIGAEAGASAHEGGGAEPSEQNPDDQQNASSGRPTLPSAR